MKINIYLKILWITFILLFSHLKGTSQAVSIINYSINANGQVQLEVNSTTQKYYILPNYINLIINKLL